MPRTRKLTHEVAAEEAGGTCDGNAHTGLRNLDENPEAARSRHRMIERRPDRRVQRALCARWPSRLNTAVVRRRTFGTSFSVSSRP